MALLKSCPIVSLKIESKAYLQLHLVSDSLLVLLDSILLGYLFPMWLGASIPVGISKKGRLLKRDVAVHCIGACMNVNTRVFTTPIYLHESIYKPKSYLPLGISLD